MKTDLELKTSNPYLQKLHEATFLQSLSDKEKKQIIQWAYEKNETALSAAVYAQVGKEDIEAIDVALKEQYGEDYDLQSLLSETLSFVYTERLTDFLEKDTSFFIGKMLRFSAPEESIRISRIVNVIVEQPGKKFFFQTEDGATLEVGVAQEKIEKIVFSRKIKQRLTGFFQNFYDIASNKKQEVELICGSTDRELDYVVSLPEGKYQFAKEGKRKKIRQDLFEQSFRFEGPQKTFFVVLEDAGSRQQISGVYIMEGSEKKSFGLFNYQAIFPQSNEFSSKDFSAIDDWIEIKENVFDSNNEKEISLREMEKFIEKTVAQLKENIPYFSMLLDNFLVNHQTGVVSSSLLSQRCFTGEIPAISDLQGRLDCLLQLCQDAGVSTTKEQLLTKILQEANTERLFHFMDNRLVLKTMTLLKESLSSLTTVKNNGIGLVIGPTGAGKSTLVNYLMGNSLEEKQNTLRKMVLDVKGAPATFAKIGQSITTSETKIIHTYLISRRLNEADSQPFLLCDCPGFGDTRGTSYDVATEIGIEQAIRMAGSVKAIYMVLPFSEFEAHRMGGVFRLFFDLAERLPALWNENSRVMDSIFLIITKYKPSDEYSFKGLLGQCETELTKALAGTDELEKKEIEDKEKILTILDKMHKAQKIKFFKHTNPLMKGGLLKLGKDVGIPKQLFKNRLANSETQTAMVHCIYRAATDWQQVLEKYFLAIEDVKTKKMELKRREDALLCHFNEKRRLEMEIKETKNRILEIKTKKEKLGTLMKNSQEEALLRFLVEETETLKKDNLQDKKIKLAALSNEFLSEEKLLETQKHEQDEKDKQKVQLEAANKKLREEIKEKSEGHETRELSRLQEAPDAEGTLRTPKMGARDLAYEEGRPLRKEEVDDERSCRWSEHTGIVRYLCIIEKKFYLVPKDPGQRKVFIEKGFLENDGEKYKAEISGEYFNIVRKRVDETGKKVIYDFQLDYRAGRKLPWFEIHYTMPKKVFYHDELITLNMQIQSNDDVIKTLIPNETKKNWIKTFVFNVSKKREEVNSLRKEIEQEKTRVIEGKNALFAKYEAEIKEKEEDIKRNEDKIFASGNVVTEAERQIKEADEELVLACAQRHQYSYFIQSQKETLEMISMFSDMVLSPISADSMFSFRKEEKFGVLSQACSKLLKFLEKNRAEIFRLSKEDLRFDQLAEQGVQLFSECRFEEAVTYFERAPQDVLSLQGGALMALYQDNLEIGLRLIAKVEAILKLQTNDERARILMLRAKMFEAIQRHAAALDCYQRAQGIVSTVADKNLEKETQENIERLQDRKCTNPCWHIDPALKAEEDKQKGVVKHEPYKLLPATAIDIHKVLLAYNTSPVPGKMVASVKVLFNPGFNRSFVGVLERLQGRKGNKAFEPRWSQDSDLSLRQYTNQLAEEMTAFYRDPKYPDVKLLPVWHGTRQENLQGILTAGYANLATTDSGFFGKGLYSTDSAAYAHRVYSKGALLVNWIAYFSAYPVVNADMNKLQGKGNYANYDAHFVPVMPGDPHNPHEVNYFPIKKAESPQYVEVVVFAPEQCLPRYLVELQDTLIPNPDLREAHGFFRTNALKSKKPLDLLAAVHHVYEKYLAVPFSRKCDQSGRPLDTLDWNYQYARTTTYRPNHGLLHVLRTMYYVSYVVEAFLAYPGDCFKLTSEEQEWIEKHVPQLQLAILFLETGRDAEIGWENQSIFEETRRRAKSNFEAYAKNVGINAVCYQRLCESFLQSTVGKDPFSTILLIAQRLDAMRYFEKAAYEKLCGEQVVPYLGEAATERLKGLVSCCLHWTGDRMQGTGKSQWYNGAVFAEASRDILKAEELIRGAIDEWQSSQLKLTF